MMCRSWLTVRALLSPALDQNVYPLTKQKLDFLGGNAFRVLDVDAVLSDFVEQKTGGVIAARCCGDRGPLPKLLLAGQPCAAAKDDESIVLVIGKSDRECVHGPNGRWLAHHHASRQTRCSRSVR